MKRLKVAAHGILKPSCKPWDEKKVAAIFRCTARQLANVVPMYPSFCLIWAYVYVHIRTRHICVNSI